jgi:hypothetical protein
LDSPHQACGRQRAKNVVDRLTRDVWQSSADCTDDRVGVGVGMCAHRIENGETRAGHPQIDLTQTSYVIFL